MSFFLKFAIIGGSSVLTPLFIEGLIDRSNVLSVEEVALFARSKERLEVVGRLCQRLLDRAKASTRIVTTTDREEAIKNSDFVILTVRVGGFRARYIDETLPLKHGLLAVTDEVTGVSGFSLALRQIPVLVDYAKTVEELAPKAWVLNFTNPTDLVTEGISRYTDTKVLGFCTAPLSYMKSLADRLNVDIKRISWDYFGLTHLGWVRGVYLDGENILPKLIDEIPRQVSEKNIKELKWYDMKLPMPIELIKAMKAIPVQYLSGRPHPYYDSSFYLDYFKGAKESRAEVVGAIYDELFRLFKNPDFDLSVLKEKRGHENSAEVVLPIIESIVHDRSETHLMELPNRGALGFLDDEAIVEVPAVARKWDVRPLVVGEIPLEARTLIQIVKNYQKLTIKAAMEGSYDLALEALVAHPFIASYKKARLVLDDLLKANRDYLPQFH